MHRVTNHPCVAVRKKRSAELEDALPDNLNVALGLVRIEGHGMVNIVRLKGALAYAKYRYPEW